VTDSPARALARVLDALGDVSIAVSGGVDSMTLAYVAHARLGARAESFHATGPAVPPEATARVRAYADRFRWRLHVVDAGEFADDAYVANPADRCYHCKHDLYSTIAPLARGTIVSGTNVDDLGDIRPGLRAASEHAVVHPFVEAGIDKDGVRAIARSHGLDDVAGLPAAPCLSSRVETGIPIAPALLAAVHAVERELTAALAPETIRCRVRANGVVVELDAGTLDGIGADGLAALADRAAAVWQDAAGEPMPVRVEPYRRGSAFLHVMVES
jgi:uncharacterized protein